MTTLTKEAILNTWKDKEVRHAIAVEHVKEGIHFQLHALREARGWTQAELARKAKMAQERISVLEDPNYDFLPKIQTLQRLADVFDVPLIVRFGTWAELLDWETNLSPDALAPPEFDRDEKLRQETYSSSEVDMSTPTNLLSVVGTPATIKNSLALNSVKAVLKESA